MDATGCRRSNELARRRDVELTDKDSEARSAGREVKQHERYRSMMRSKFAVVRNRRSETEMSSAVKAKEKERSWQTMLRMSRNAISQDTSSGFVPF